MSFWLKDTTAFNHSKGLRKTLTMEGFYKVPAKVWEELIDTYRDELTDNTCNVHVSYRKYNNRISRIYVALGIMGGVLLSLPPTWRPCD